jgi:hypothetical protein
MCNLLTPLGKKATNAISTVRAICSFVMLALLASIASAQTAPPADVPITHVVLSATFTGYDAQGKMQPANIDTFGLAVTKSLTASYEHIAVPSLGQRWEMGLLAYTRTFPKIKALVFDSSNFTYTFSAGGGKLLSTTDGNRLAFTAGASVTYPIAGHMGWQVISYQYLHASGGITGVVNRSYQSASTGPLFYF